MNVPLAASLTAEDHDEETGEKSPHDRLTCPIHLRWVHECAHSPLHVASRWCRTCDIAADIAVDEVTGTVAMRCPRCLRTPGGSANRRTIAACRTSITAARTGSL